jgi:putative ABC transport system substrate-binding protein
MRSGDAVAEIAGNSRSAPTEVSMRLIRLAVVLVLGLALAPLAVGAQPPAKVPRIVVLSWAPAGGDAGENSVIEEGLQTLGYTRGASIVIDHRSAEGREDRLPGLAREAVALNPAVIIAVGTKAALAAKQATKHVPIVTVAGDIVASGIVKSLRRPEGNITGLSFFHGELMLKRFELLMEMAPKIRQLVIFVLGQPSPTVQESFTVIRTTGQKKAVDVRMVTVERVDDVAPAFAKLRDTAMIGVIVSNSPVIDARAMEVGRLAAEHRLIAAMTWKDYARGGGLMAYGPDLLALWRRAVTYVDRILRGASPAELPIEQPTKFELVINLKTAKALGLTIPQTLLQRADQVIE